MEKILITGSEGRIGKIITKDLEKDYKLILLDRKFGIDILQQDIKPYFQGVQTIIHLAANPAPNINKKEAEKNIDISRKVIDACESAKGLKRILNASSINVYDYITLFEAGKKLTNKTPLSPNARFGDPSYGQAKIKVEKMFKEYCKKRGISLLNLRIGCVTDTNLPNRQEGGHIEPIDYPIHLKHEDLIKIIRQGLKYDGIGSHICVSKKDGYIDQSIRFPIQ